LIKEAALVRAASLPGGEKGTNAGPEICIARVGSLDAVQWACRIQWYDGVQTSSV
jgi:hypothetical protein